MVEKIKHSEMLSVNKSDAIVVVSGSGKIEFWNDAAQLLYGYSAREVIGKEHAVIIPPRFRRKDRLNFSRVSSLRQARSGTYDLYGLRKDGSEVPIEVSFVRFLSEGKPFYYSIMRDRSRHVLDFDNMRKSRDALEARVRERTKKLQTANEKLKELIAECRVAEKKLQRRERELLEKTAKLEEMNVAMRVLIEQTGKQSPQISKAHLADVQRLIIPYLEKMEKQCRDCKKHIYLDILRQNIDSLLKALQSSTEVVLKKLTGAERYVADMVSLGKSSKEIADLLHVSLQTVKFHRKQIRKKIGITGAKGALLTHLKSVKGVA